MKKLRVLIAKLIAIAFGVTGIWCGIISYERSLLNYSDEGSYFTGKVILHEQAIGAYLTIALASLLLAAVSWYIAIRLAAPKAQSGT